MAVIDDVLTMRPTPCGIIRAAAALSIKNEPVTFTAITRSNSSRLHSWSGTGQAMPARLTRPTTGGSSESICWYASVTDDSEAMSVGTASRFSCPASRSSFSTLARPSALMSTSATCQPFSPNIRAVTRPMPAGPPAPVTTAVRSSGNRNETVDVSAAGADVIAAPSSRPASVDQGGEDVADIGTVLADHGDRVAAVVLAQEGAAEAEVESLADRGAVVDQAEVHRHREGQHLTCRRVLITQIVLDVPVVGVRQHLVEHVWHRLDRAVQPNEVADVRVQAAGLVPDFFEELHCAVAGPAVGVFIHLQGDLLAVAGGVLGELTDQRHGTAARLRRFIVMPTIDQPKPQRALQFFGEPLKEAKADERHAQLRRLVEQPVAVGQVLLAVFGIHHAAARGRNGGNG